MKKHEKIILVFLFIVGVIIGILIPRGDAHGQTITQPTPNMFVGQPTELSYGVTNLNGEKVSATYFKFEYDPNTIRIDTVISKLPEDWKIVYQIDKEGMVEVAMLSTRYRLYEGDMFALVLTPIEVGSSDLRVTDLSWTDCNGIIDIPETVPERPIRDNPTPDEVAAMYSGTTYWVDSEFGNDSFPDCTDFDTPCLTTEPFIGKLLPGDAVLFMGGIHRLSVTPVKSGTVNAPITFQGYPGEDAVLTGSDLFTNVWVENSDGSWTASYTTSLPQHPAIAKPQPQWRPEMLIVNDTLYNTVYERSSVVDNSFYIEGPSTSPSSVTARFNGRDPNTLKIEMAKRSYVFSPNENTPVDFIMINSITMKHAGNSFGKKGCLEVRGNNWSVYEVLVTECNTTGIKFYGSNHYFGNVAANYNGVVGWASEGGNHTLVEDSYAIGNNTKGFLPNWHAGGVKVSNGTSFNTWSRFHSEDNNGPGIWFDIPLNQQNTIRDSYFMNNRVAGIFMENGTITTTVQNNVVFGTRKFNGTGVGIRFQAASDNLVINNTIYGNYGDGVYEKYKDKRNTPGHNVLVRNIIGYNAIDDAPDYEIRIDRDPGEFIVDHFSDNIYVRQVGEDFTFRIENDWTGNDNALWLQRQLHIYPFDVVVPRTTQVLENPNSRTGFRSLLPGYGMVLEDPPIDTGIEH